MLYLLQYNFIFAIIKIEVNRMEKYVYSFNEGNKDMRNLLGGKGANLAEMKSIGLPVPNGFTVTT